VDVVAQIVFECFEALDADRLFQVRIALYEDEAWHANDAVLFAQLWCLVDIYLHKFDALQFAVV